MFTQKGFSLLEVGVALLILGIAVTSIFQFISSTTLSVYDLENRTFARQVANNRMALVQTLEPMMDASKKFGQTAKFIKLAGDINIETTSWTIKNIIKILKKSKKKTRKMF